jgi:hypothetical protein
MKVGKDHRVPLSKAALAILGRKGDGFIFPGGKAGKPLSNMAMLKLLERMGRTDLTVHGFRSAFRDWAAARTNFPNEVVEMALAHSVSNKVEAAYRRGDLFDKRCKLMEAWANYCAGRPAMTEGNVVPMRAAELVSWMTISSICRARENRRQYWRCKGKIRLRMGAALSSAWCRAGGTICSKGDENSYSKLDPIDLRIRAIDRWLQKTGAKMSDDASIGCKFNRGMSGTVLFYTVFAG